MDKYKIVGKLRQLFFGSMAVVMSAGGVVATNLQRKWLIVQKQITKCGMIL